MVTMTIEIDEKQERIVSLVKGMHGFRNKTDAIRHIIQSYEEEVLEPALRPEFIEKMQRRRRQPTIRIDNFRKHFGLDNVRNKLESGSRKDSTKISKKKP